MYECGLTVLSHASGLRGLVGNDAVAPVTVEVDYVVIARAFVQVAAKRIERGRAQNRYFGCELLVVDQFHQGARDGTILNVLLVRTGRDQQDIEPVPRQVLGERRRIGHVIELTLDVAVLGEIAPLRVVQRLPGPGQDKRIVGGDAQLEMLRALTHGVMVEIPALARTEKRLERMRAPALQGVEQPIGPLDIG